MDIEKFIIDGVENAVKTSFSTEKIEERYEPPHSQTKN